jgi:hypothetical protein
MAEALTFFMYGNRLFHDHPWSPLTFAIRSKSSFDPRV